MISSDWVESDDLVKPEISGKIQEKIIGDTKKTSGLLVVSRPTIGIISWSADQLRWRTWQLACTISRLGGSRVTKWAEHLLVNVWLYLLYICIYIYYMYIQYIYTHIYIYIYVPKQNTTCSESRERGPICHGLSFALFGHFFLSVGRITHEYEIIFSFNWMVFTCFKSWFHSSFRWYWFYSWTEIVSKVGNPMIMIVITIITRTKTTTNSNHHSHIFLTIITTIVTTTKHPQLRHLWDRATAWPGEDRTAWERCGGSTQQGAAQASRASRASRNLTFWRSTGHKNSQSQVLTILTIPYSSILQMMAIR